MLLPFWHQALLEPLARRQRPALKVLLPQRIALLSKLNFRRLGSILLLSILFFSPPLLASDPVEEATIAVGVTAGNMWFVPIKAISALWGLATGGLAYVVFGGDADMARQIWEDTTQGPYLITPEVARGAIGKKPEPVPD